MQLINPFQKIRREPSQEQLMDKQHELNVDADIRQSAISGQVMDEELFQQRENMMAELTRWQQNLSPMLKELFLNLAGLREDDDGSLHHDPMAKPACSVFAAKRWVDFVKPIDKNVMNGAWTIKQINDSMIWIDRTIRQDIMEHYENYNIEYSVATFDYICNMIINAVYPTFLRGLENGERKYHGQIQKIIETKNILPEKEKQSLFGKKG